MINFQRFTEIIENSQIAKFAEDEGRTLDIKPTADNDHLLRLIAFNRHELENKKEDEAMRSRRIKAIKELQEELAKRGVNDVEEEIKKLFKRR